MQIKNKFNIGQEIYLVLDDEIVQAQIDQITVSSFNSKELLYSVKKPCGRCLYAYSESEIYETREEAEPNLPLKEGSVVFYIESGVLGYDRAISISNYEVILNNGRSVDIRLVHKDAEILREKVKGLILKGLERENEQ